MLLTITTTAEPASDLGYLLHKHPDKVQRFSLAFGEAHVFYPEADLTRCTAALQVEVDPVKLVRGRPTGFTLGQYVNDRPYAASSLLAVAIVQVFGSALNGRCAARPDLPERALPLQIHVPSLPARGGGAELVARLFEPLGWTVAAKPLVRDPEVPRWGESPYVDLHLTGTKRLRDALRHLYVLLPVLDNDKHYWVGPDEVDKLLRVAADWLPAHPEEPLITRRYLRHSRPLVTRAEERLSAGEMLEALDDHPEPDEPTISEDDRPTPLFLLRRDAVVAALHEHRCQRVVDLGCGEGQLLAALVKDAAFTEIVGVDVSATALDRAADRLHLDWMSERQAGRITLRQSSLTYVDPALAGFDALVLMEVVEHVDADRLPALVHSVFASARPRVVVLTTPNVEHNVRYGLEPGRLRHPDHRFEWTRAELADWAQTVADAHGYTVELRGVGEPDPEVGAPTQLALFTRREG